MAMLSIFGVLIFLPHLFAFDPYTKYTQLNLTDAFGPDSVSLDRFYQGPYVGLQDGRIQKYTPNVGFLDFAYTSPNRTKQLCDGTPDINLGPTCGRPFGFSFNPSSGELFIVDAYLGLYKVGTNGGQATFLANNANGVAFNFLNGIDYDSLTGLVYLTDASLNYNLQDAILGKNMSGDSTGRLMAYDTKTGQIKVLLQGFPMPSGPAVSVDSSFLVFSSFVTDQIFKFWLVGPKANTVEKLLDLPGSPVKVKRAATLGEFWVPVNIRQPNLVIPFGYKFNSFGQILLVKDLSDHYPNAQVNVLQEYIGGQMYVGSRTVSYVGIYSRW